MTGTRILLAAFFAMAAVFALAGCAQNYNERDHQACLNLGTQPGQDSYVQCRVGLANIREQRRANAWAAYGTMMQNYQRSLQIQQQNRPVNCYHTDYTTSCY